MAVLILFVPVFDLTSTYWGGYGRLGIPLVAVAIGGVLDLILAATLVGPYGALGATIANVGGQALAASILIVITIRRLPSLSMTWGRYVGVLATTAVVSVGAGWCKHRSPGLRLGCGPAGNGQFTGAVRRRVRLHVRARRSVVV